MPSFRERLLLLPSALLALSVSYVQANVVAARDTQSNTVPACLSILPDSQWNGIDGAWSSFQLGIGTPPQDVHTFVSWSIYQTLAVGYKGCDYASDFSACAKTRGGIYNESDSSTFNNKKGIYNMWVGKPLGLYENAIYGFDKVSLQGPDGNGPTLSDALVGEFARTDFYLGIFGLNPKPTNFSSITDGAPSYMTLLKEQNYIPSVSFGYTAGAQYRSNTSFASLTLGGYDESKFVKNDLTWTMAPDNSRDVVVAIHSITTPSDDPASPVGTLLLPAPIYAYLDALVAEIWLPIESCNIFEYIFGLQFDEDSELYLVNDTQHRNLTERNASITFQLGISTTSAETVSIELPYAAFDLTAKPPYQNLSTDSPSYFYFPLRRAADETQYWIGRTFFQEAYISVDYERQQFNVSQRNWDETASEHLVPIPSYTGQAATSGSSASSSDSLSGGAIAGIVVGAVAVVILLALFLVLFFRRRAKAAEHEKLDSDADSTNNNTSPVRPGTEPTVFQKAELEGSTPPQIPPLISGALSFNDSGSGSGAGTPSTPQHLSGATFVSPRGLRASDSPTYESPEDGTGTQSSTNSSSGTRNTGLGSTGTGTLMSLVSPISPGSAGEASEADSQERKLYEMPGDRPIVREKDGKELSEKEAYAYREHKYNGVESPVDPQIQVPNFSRSSLQGPRRVNPEDVATTNTVLRPGSEPRSRTRHRAFSFEEERSAENTEELYSAS